jgi:serine/threonine protein kinase
VHVFSALWNFHLVFSSLLSLLFPPSFAQTAGRGFLDWQLYIIQEYCEGGSLFDAIQQRRFHNPKTKLPYLDQVRVLVKREPRNKKTYSGVKVPFMSYYRLVTSCRPPSLHSHALWRKE